jgi:hypothetical protein
MGKRFQDAKADLQQIRQTNLSPIDLPFLRKRLIELARADEKYYRQLMLLLHPDKVGSNHVLAELAKDVNAALKTTESPLIVTAKERKYVEMINKIDVFKTEARQLAEYPVNIAFLLNQWKISKIHLSYSLIASTIRTFFDLISDNLIMLRYPEDSQIRKSINIQHNNLDIIKSNNKVHTAELELYKSYKTDLASMISNHNKKIRRKLEKLIVKENK